MIGPAVHDSGDAESARRRLIRRVFALETVLVFGLLALAHGLLDVDWIVTGAWAGTLSAIGGVLGVIGCALALSSELIIRRYRVVR